jgi:3-dehydrotetronate 4-kinase
MPEGTRQSAMRLGCIADDYTGATDLASALTESGLRVAQLFGLPDPATPHPDEHETDAIVVALKTRNLPAPEAVADTLTTLTWLRHQPIDTIMFK